jgi:eukaryotic-like serine/threonine-protein kinase
VEHGAAPAEFEAFMKQPPPHRRPDGGLQLGNNPELPPPAGSDEDTATNAPPPRRRGEPPVPQGAPACRDEVAPDPDTDDDAVRALGSTQVIGNPSSAPTVAKTHTDPRVLGDFELIEKLGEGAMGAVFRARQISFDREVALKVLFPHVAKNPKLVERLRREGEAMALLDHPNIVQPFALVIDEIQKHYFVAMEFVEGQNLQKWLAKVRRFSVADSVYIIVACARGLGHAHKKNLVHRDIKPENILLTRAGAVKIADLGMVKNFDDDMSLTQTGHAVGTPWYMPLEQAKNAKDTDGRCDIYALGCTLYCLLTGNPPFAGATILDVIRAKEQGTFPPARSANPEVPERLDLVIAKMTAKLPRYRYQTCADVVHDLESLGLAGTRLSVLSEPTANAANPSSSSGEIVSPSSAAETEPDPNVWYVRLKGPDGQPVLRRYTTAQLLTKLGEKTISPRTQAAHSPKQSFRALATFREFEGSALSQASKEAADMSTVSYRNLYKKIDEQDRKRGETARKRAAAWPGWINPVLTISGIVLGVALLAGFFYWVATSLTK